MTTPQDCKFTKDHEWAKIEGGLVRVGITAYAQKELGDVVFVDLPKPGTQVTAGESFATVESVKAVSDIYAPATGIVKEANPALSDSPQLINESPYADAWMVTIEVAPGESLEKLMTPSDYDRFTQEISK